MNAVINLTNEHKYFRVTITLLAMTLDDRWPGTVLLLPNLVMKNEE